MITSLKESETPTNFGKIPTHKDICFQNVSLYIRIKGQNQKKGF